MRALISDARQTGGMRLAGDVGEPAQGDHEALVAVSAISINAGELRLLDTRPDGFRPGQDVAGTVVRAAPDGTGPAVGTPVVAYPEWEGWAERVAVSTDWLAVLPDTVGFEVAASLPVAGLTGLRALRRGGSVLGRRVLVTGASGGVGHFAVQLAELAGAHVTALVSRPERMADVIGASTVVWSLDDDGLGPFDLVLDGVGGGVLPQALHRAAPNGTVVLYGGAPSQLALRDFYEQAWNARLIGLVSPVPDDEKGRDLEFLVSCVERGRITPHVTSFGSWTRIGDALDALARRGVVGKIVLTVD